MSELAHRTVETNGIRMHIAERARGRSSLLCHGFPESWYSWRHQLAALAEAGYHAVAPDMRGYGQTDRPEAIDQYSLLHLVGDIVGLLDALGEPTAVVAGHDWGAPVAWHAALLRPDRFRAVVGLSVPFRPRRHRAADDGHAADAGRGLLPAVLPGAGRRRGGVRTRSSRDHPRHLCLGSGEPASRRKRSWIAATWAWCARDGGFLPIWRPRSLPPWLTEADVDFYAAEFGRTGFRGGLNWYRNIDRNWELLAPFAGAKVICAGALRRGRTRCRAGFSRRGRLHCRAWRISFRNCGGRSCCRAAATGPSRSEPRRSTPL